MPPHTDILPVDLPLLQRLQQQEQPVVVDVWAPWCGPCRAMAPQLAAVAQQYAGRVELWKVNADENPDLVRALGIFGIPTLLVYRNGAEVARHTGSLSNSAMQHLFELSLAADNAGGQAAEQARQHRGPADHERKLRLLVAAALLMLAAFTGWPIVLLIAAAAVFFSAIHDRCPLWQAVKGRLSRQTSP
jgi:thioredoxin